MFPTAAALSVDDAAKKQLESLARSGTTPQRVAQKCRVILLAQEGMSNHSIAKQLGLSRPTVIAARAAFGAGGVQVLTAKPTRNRPRRTLTAEYTRHRHYYGSIYPVEQRRCENRVIARIHPRRINCDAIHR